MNEEAEKAATEAARAMDRHGREVHGKEFDVPLSMPNNKTTIRCDECGVVVYDGPYLEGGDGGRITVKRPCPN